MAFDGITVAALTAELNTELKGGRISKIIQPERDELLLTVHTPRGQKRLLLSASASLPLAYLTETNKKAPLTAPNFCMLLRKHILNGRITKISQPGLERVIHIEVEHYNELQDLVRKVLIVELMGKYSNIIFCDESMQILDSIKHVSASVSSVREVLPGRAYFLPDTMNKLDPLTVTESEFRRKLQGFSGPVQKALYTSFTGISPKEAEEICWRCSIAPEAPAFEVGGHRFTHLFHQFSLIMDDIRTANFRPCMYYSGTEDPIPVDYSALPLSMYEDYPHQNFDSMSELILQFHSEKEIMTRISQKSHDLRHIVQTALERARKKQIIQETQLSNTEKRDHYRVCGEMLNTYGYTVPDGSSIATLNNYYTDEPIKIPLDKRLTVSENAQHYFERYNKLKRTFDAVKTQLADTQNEVRYLETVELALSIARSEEDLAEIREELASAGIIRKAQSKKKQQTKSEPLHYLSSDGFDMYVGKNNLQNEFLTFKLADGGDWWFHAKQMPGSHVIVKAHGGELPDATFEEAARLAAHYSSGSGAEKTEVDYVQKKHIKKPGGARPGFVIYHTNYSMMASTDISDIKAAD